MIDFAYSGDILNEGFIAQHIKVFSFKDNNYYLMGLLHDANEVRYVGRSVYNICWLCREKQ